MEPDAVTSPHIHELGMETQARARTASQQARTPHCAHVGSPTVCGPLRWEDGGLCSSSPSSCGPTGHVCPFRTGEAGGDLETRL